MPCGKCEYCRRSKAREWAFRLEEEAYNKYTYNCLLTYDDAHLPMYKGHPSLNKVDIQLFMKRLREQIRKQYGTIIKFFCCGEYGGKKHRPHYHMILFSEKKLTNKGADPYRKINKILVDAWRHGLADIEPLTDVGGSVNYLTSYMITYYDGVEYDQHNKPFLMMSRCGLGKSWIDRHPQQVQKMVNEIDYTTSKNGYKLQLPRYLRRKIMPEEQQIAFADGYYDYSTDYNFNNKFKFRKQHETEHRKLLQEREYQRQREREDYRKGKIHANNSNTSQLSRRVTTAEK